MVNIDRYKEIIKELSATHTTLVAVSKTKPVADLEALYQSEQRDFGENYVQELVEKHRQLPEDIRWHFIGHLQTNKVKTIVPFVHLIHSVDSGKLLKEINKQAAKSNKVVKVLLQVFIAGEETKYGLDEAELDEIIHTELQELKYVSVCGLMGMASFSDNTETVKTEFKTLKGLFDKYKNTITNNQEFQILSMGMSGDYRMAIEEGSNLVRIGSLLFGERQKPV
jgi:pyridoxal phosphate enzyme (YggS family)